MLIAYASRTGTRRNLDALREAGWRLLVSATGVQQHEGFPYALDNGAWTAYQQRKPFHVDAFERALVKLGTDADWVAVPDIVGAGLESLAFSLAWLPRGLAATAKALIVVQDGMTIADVRPHLSERVGIFVGGTDDGSAVGITGNWKERTCGQWGSLAREVGTWCHVGRVNTRRRINICAAAGVTSIDGTSASKYVKNVRPLDAWRRQGSLLVEDK